MRCDNLSMNKHELTHVEWAKLETGGKVDQVRCGESSILGLPKEFIVAALDASNQENRDDVLVSTINKLDRLISDPITRENTCWITRLLKLFLREVEPNGYVSFLHRRQISIFDRAEAKRFSKRAIHQMLQDLHQVSRLLEFVASRSRKVTEYGKLLDRMLRLCKLRPILEKSSDLLRCNDALQSYFSTLGHLTKLLDTDREILIILEAVFDLLDENCNNDKLSAASSLNLEMCQEAIQKSRLPIFLTELLRDSSPDVYARALDVVLAIITISIDCCYKMMQAGILDHLLSRMSYRDEGCVQFACSNEQLISERDVQASNVALTSHIAWYLMKSILHEQTSKKHACGFEKLNVPSIDAMRSLRDAFRHHVTQSNGGKLENRVLRNDLAVLILSGLAIRPSWHLVRCGLAEDLVALSLKGQSGVERNNENLIFRKILLTILYHLSSRSAAIAIMTKRGVIAAILETIDPSNFESGARRSTSLSQFWYLAEFALRTVGRLAKRMPEEFVRSGGPLRLRKLVAWSLTVEFDIGFTLELARTICSIATSESRLIVGNLAAEGLIPLLTQLIRRILSFASLNLQHQRILTLLILTMEEGDCVGSGDTLSVETIVQLLHRCFQRRSKQDFHLDQRFLVAIGSYIWKCVTPCPERSDEFVEKGGIFAMLDVIEEQASANARCVFLGILTDMVVDGYGAPHLSTWRGVNKTNGFVSLLGKCWREEEIRIGVKRSVDGCIDDVELPIMGTEQWINVFHGRHPGRNNFSPALGSLLASVRPKIYCLRKMMTSESSDERYRRSQEHYKILVDAFPQLPLEDRITMYVADNFYRFVQGELWAEVAHNLEQSGLNVLGMDGEIIQLMNQRHRDWGMYVRGLQNELLRAEKKKETERERDEISKIRDSRLSTALSALNEVDYLRRTTERDYMLAMNKKQRDRANEVLKFPRLVSEREHCHRTLNQRFNVTTILDQNHSLPSAYDSADSPDVKLTPVLPVSPVDSSRLSNYSIQ